MPQPRIPQRVPQTTFHVRSNDTWVDRTSDAVFADQTVVLFALPGAFTPTCSSAHLPRYNELAATFKANGVDRIACLSVNDAYVMQAWARDQNAKHIDFLPDGNAEFTRAMGLLVDQSATGFGQRSRRYSMLVHDRHIEKIFLEADEPGDPFEVSDADTMLRFINRTIQLPPRITMISKPGCPHCARARQRLAEHALAFEEIVLGRRGISYSSLQALCGQDSAPQIFIDVGRVGGADDLENWLGRARARRTAP